MLDKLARISRFWPLAMLAACGESAPRPEDPQLGSYDGVPAGPEAPRAVEFDECPAGLVETTPGEQPGCQPQAEPKLPRLAQDCPVGFRTDALPSDLPGTVPIPACRPRLPTGRCADGERVELAGGGCVPVGSVCTEGNAWPAQLPDGTATVYARANASAGTGTAAKPYGTFAQAYAATPDGGVLVLGPGTYQGSAVVDRAVTIVGVCPTRTIIEGPASSVVEVEGDPTSLEGTLDVQDGGELALQDVTVRGQRIGLHVLSGGSASLTGVRFDQNFNKAIVIDGGSLSLSDAVVERSTPTSDGRLGRGLQVNLGGSAVVENVTFQDNDRNEIAAFDPATSVQLLDVVVQNTRLGNGAGGYGIYATASAALEAERVVVRSKATAAMLASAGATMNVTHAYVTQMQADADGLGIGLWSNGGHMVVTSSVITDSTYGGMLADKAGSLAATDVSISTTYGMPGSLEFGRAVSAWEGADVSLERVFVDRSQEAGLYVNGAKVDATDFVSQGNLTIGILAEEGAEVSVLRGSSSRDGGVGAMVRLGAQLSLADVGVIDVDPLDVRGDDIGWGTSCFDSRLTLDRVSVRRVQEYGLALLNCQATISSVALEDVKADLVDTQPGLGISMLGGRLDLAGVLVRRVEGGGMLLGSTDTESADGKDTPPSVVTGGDVVVRDMLSDTNDTRFALGLTFQAGSDATLERVLVERVRTVGVRLSDDAEVTLKDLSVSDVDVEELSGRYGYGIALADGAHLTLERAQLSKTSTTGIMAVGLGTSLNAADLSVSSTRQVDDQNGVGLAVLSGAGVIVERATLSDHHAAGVLTQFAGAFVGRDLTISDIASGTFANEDIFGNNVIEGASDCVLALSRSTVELERVILRGCQRVGLLFDDASGHVSQTRVEQAPLGLALQGFPQPELDWSSLGAPVGGVGYMTGSKLLVPASSPPILSPGAALDNLVRAQ